MPIGLVKYFAVTGSVATIREGADISVAVRVVSDQPVVVATNFQFNPWGMPNVCHQAR